LKDQTHTDKLNDIIINDYR